MTHRESQVFGSTYLCYDCLFKCYIDALNSYISDINPTLTSYMIVRLCCIFCTRSIANNWGGVGAMWVEPSMCVVWIAIARRAMIILVSYIHSNSIATNPYKEDFRIRRTENYTIAYVRVHEYLLHISVCFTFLSSFTYLRSISQASQQLQRHPSSLDLRSYWPISQSIHQSINQSTLLIFQLMYMWRLFCVFSQILSPIYLFANSNMGSRSSLTVVDTEDCAHEVHKDDDDDDKKCPHQTQTKPTTIQPDVPPETQRTSPTPLTSSTLSTSSTPSISSTPSTSSASFPYDTVQHWNGTTTFAPLHSTTWLDHVGSHTSDSTNRVDGKCFQTCNIQRNRKQLFWFDVISGVHRFSNSDRGRDVTSVCRHHVFTESGRARMQRRRHRRHLCGAQSAHTTERSGRQSGHSERHVEHRLHDLGVRSSEGRRYFPGGQL